MKVDDSSWGWRTISTNNDNPAVPEACQGNGSDFQEDIVDGTSASWAYFNTFERGSFIWLPAGTEVLLAEEAATLHIVSLIPGTVTAVSAYQQFADTSLLMSVPTSMYTVTTTDYNGYDVVELTLTAPLSTIIDEDWDDEIYVSFSSDIGPNPVDIIEWLVDTYTTLDKDTSSFTSVKTDLTAYPTNFFLKERVNVLQLIQDIAFQARCAVFVRDNTISIVYLSKEPTSIVTITESDIIANTFRISHTSTEDLETRQTISWSEGEAGVFKTDPTDFEFTLKHNIPAYGLFDASYDWYTMNIFEMVQKSATFWLIRNSKTWKMVEFEVPLIHLDLDVFDCITLNIAEFPTTKVIIEEATYNATDNTIRMKCWTPILAGTDVPYVWAWPAAQGQFARWPQNDELSGSGDGVGLLVEAPVGHPLRGAFNPDQTTQQTDGDTFPSDVGDVIPALECKVATGNELQDTLAPDFDPFEPLAEQNFQDRLDDIESGLINGAELDDQEEREACGKPILDGGGCVYEVNVHYITPDLVTTFQLSGSPCPTAGPCKKASGGRPCTGATHTFCHTFRARFAAEQFKASKQQEADALWANCGYSNGKTDVLRVFGINAIEGEGFSGECEPGPGDENDPKNDAGQTHQPALSSGDPGSAPDPGDL
jgi:hypothetical protein